jgi:hypothetical protein
MIATELWAQSKTSAEAPSQLVNLFRQWETGTLSHDQYKTLMNQILGEQVSKPRNRPKTIKKWAEELQAVRELLVEVQKQIDERSKMGDLPTTRLWDAVKEISGGVLHCLDVAKQYGKPPTFIDTARLQRLVVEVLGKFFPGQPLPNIEAPA